MGSNETETNAAALIAAQVPDVSIIVPMLTDDVSRVRDFLASMDRQTYSMDEVELLMVDNGVSISVARTLEVAALTRPWLILTSCDEPGAYAARNAALGRARGTIIAFTDIDCLPAPDWIEAGCEAMIRGGIRHMVAGKIEQRFANETRPSLIEAYDKLMSLRQEWYVAHGAAATANLFVTKWVAERIGPFDESVFSGSDTRWVRSATSIGVALTYAEHVRVDHPCRRTPSAHLTRARRAAGAVSGRDEDLSFKLIRALSHEYALLRTRLALLRNRHRDEPTYYPYLMYLSVAAGTHACRMAEVVKVHVGGTPERR